MICEGKHPNQCDSFHRIDFAGELDIKKTGTEYTPKQLGENPEIPYWTARWSCPIIKYDGN